MRFYLALALALCTLASTAGAQQGVNLANTTSAFYIDGLLNHTQLAPIDFHFSYTFPGASAPHTFTLSGITQGHTGPADWFTVNAGNAAGFGIDWPRLASDYANHHPGYGTVAGPVVSIDTALGTFSNPVNGSQWNFVTTNAGIPTMLTQLQARVGFARSTTGTWFDVTTILSGVAYVYPEPSACAMLLPVFALVVRRRYHG